MTVDTLIGVTTFIADSFAMCATAPYEGLPGGGKQRADDHSLFDVLHNQANDEMTAFEFKGTFLLNGLFSGTSYAEIVRDGAGLTRALWPIETHRVTPFRQGGQLRYRVQNHAAPDSVIDKSDMLTWRGPSFDGL